MKHRKAKEYLVHNMVGILTLYKHDLKFTVGEERRAINSLKTPRYPSLLEYFPVEPHWMLRYFWGAPNPLPFEKSSSDHIDIIVSARVEFDIGFER